jgi:hypothetical protein
MPRSKLPVLSIADSTQVLSVVRGMFSANRGVRVSAIMASAPIPKPSTPHWVVSCPACYTVFSYSAIPPRSLSVPFDPLWPRKPDFPDGGESLTCPACQKTSKFQRFELMYRIGLRKADRLPIKKVHLSRTVSS